MTLISILTLIGQKFNNDFIYGTFSSHFITSDYLAFVDEMVMLMSNSEVAKDDTSIEALHERHSEHKVIFVFRELNSSHKLQRDQLGPSLYLAFLIAKLLESYYKATLK